MSDESGFKVRRTNQPPQHFKGDEPALFKGDWNMSQHSPGPWRSDRVLGADNQPLYEITVDGDGVVAYVEAHDDTDRENAKLIASAPTMLSLLKELEWSATDEIGEAGWCPTCSKHKTNGRNPGHTPDCRLAKLLESLK